MSQLCNMIPPLELQEDIVISGNTQLRRDGRTIVVTFAATLLSNGITSDSIPLGYRPFETTYNVVLTISNSVSKPAYVAIGTSGDIRAYCINTDGSATAVTGAIYGELTYMI